MVLLADAATGTVLAERGGTLSLPPASLAKLMTLHLSLEDTASGRMEAERVYAIPAGGFAADMRWGSSVLGLQEGDAASLETLQRAAAVASAGDAAWSIAILSSGSGDAFVDRMNKEARAIGLRHTEYVDPDGWSALGRTTGVDQLRLALYYLSRHASVLPVLHAPEFMHYGPEDQLAFRPVRRNTNLLVGKYGGADGLKTGTIPSAGFHFVATAKRGSTRLVAVCMGLDAAEYRDGLIRRAKDAAALLDWGFARYVTWVPTPPRIPVISVRHGADPSIRPVPAGEMPRRTLEMDQLADISVFINVVEDLAAPVALGDRLGSVRWMDGERIVAEIPLVADREIARRWRLFDLLRP